jgi:hypothetical protein
MSQMQLLAVIAFKEVPHTPAVSIELQQLLSDSFPARYAHGCCLQACARLSQLGCLASASLQARIQQCSPQLAAAC